MKKIKIIFFIFIFFAGCGSQKHENPFSPENIEVYSITPSGFTAEPGDKEIFLHWNTSEDNLLDHFTIYKNDIGPNGAYKKIADLKKSIGMYKDKNLKNGTQYYYKLAATNVRNIEGTAADPISCIPVSSKPPLTPKNFIIDPYDKKNFLKWDLNDELDLKGYFIYRNNFSNGEFQKIASVSSNANSFIDTGLKNGIRYYYKITAYNLANLESFYSSTLSGTPFTQESH